MIITTIESIDQPLNGASSIGVKVTDGTVSIKIQLFITKDAADRLLKAMDAAKRASGLMDEQTAHELLLHRHRDLECECGMRLMQDD